MGVTVYDLSGCCCTVESTCCPSGELKRTLNADLSSAAGPWNGSFTLTYNDGLSLWEGWFTVTDDEYCGFPCSQRFTFQCDAFNELWKFIAEESGGDFEGCASGSCTLRNLRVYTTDGTSCTPLDINMVTGSLAVFGSCACYANVAVTVRIYE